LGINFGPLKVHVLVGEPFGNISAKVLSKGDYEVFMFIHSKLC
jgi:hypothetical protein